ncbi:unnamed protein product [Medioppia subpectinata]|uniref:Fatty acid synthase n=1 Tax=Medioppia subpectinata TaxID=1979941 RepID=A0A7R9PV01_9ACAR|nr:unnamed protein product [Medioppia subpectinata]CAG2102302.1 unnamed protein product [Medioppia subpectinata]
MTIPDDMRDTQTAVYVGAFNDESIEALCQDPATVSMYAAVGTKRTMLANRVSYVFNFHGPSLSLDTACSSSLVAAQIAYSGIRAGDFDAAIVAGVNIAIKPLITAEFAKLGMLSPVGRCKYLDASADGYVRSETVSVALLQRRRDARRVYATVIHSKVNSDGYKVEGQTFPSPKTQLSLIMATLKESEVNPNWIRYVEAHGTGTQAGDRNETMGIVQAFCADRSEPLLVGSVKSNLGHSESAAGMNQLAKLVITMENRKIPAIYGLKTPNPAIEPLMKGQIKPVTENTPFEDCVVAINSFGFGGTNAHMLIRPNTRPATPVPNNGYREIPRLVLTNGRTEESVDYIMDFIENNSPKASDDFLALLNEVKATDGMDWRGYLARDVKSKNYVQLRRNTSKISSKRQVWLVCNGMGAQWLSMGKQMMEIDIFRKSIEKSAEIIRPYGIDLMQLVLGDDPNLFAPISSSSTSLIAIQIALIDLLKALGVEADGYFGHSAGEMGCGYINGVLTQEEFIMIGYNRRCVQDLRGLMAAVGMSWDEVKKRCPPGVEAACHNSPNSVTVSGDEEAVARFVAELKAENVFTKVVNSSNIPFHSSIVKNMYSTLLDRYRTVIADKRLRSDKWISTSIPADKWAEDECKYSSAEYYVNNLVEPVLFKEALDLVPEDAVIIEIGADSVFRNLIKQNYPSLQYVGLMKRNDTDSLANFLAAIGELYNLGLNPRVENLYPKVTFPVERGTQSLSSLIKWDHSDDYLVPLYPDYFNPRTGDEINISIDFKLEENQFYFGHVIDGRVLFPATGYLYIVWQELAKQSSIPVTELPVIFANVHFLRATIIKENTVLTFKFHYSKLNGEFCIYNDNQLTVSGRMSTPDKYNQFLPLGQNFDSLMDRKNQNYSLNKADVYKELRIRGYEYKDLFQSITSVDVKKNTAKVENRTNWVTFADAMLHFALLSVNTRDLVLPTSIDVIHCDPRIFKANAGEDILEIFADPMGDYCITRGLEIYGFNVNRIDRRKQSEELCLEKYVFIPYFEKNALKEDMEVLVETYVSILDDMITNGLNGNKTKLTNKLNNLLAINELSDDMLVLKDIIEEKLNNNTKSDSNILETEDGRKLCSDLINNTYLNEYLLRPAVDLILENNNSFHTRKEFNVLEINFSEEVCYQSVVDYLKDSFYNLKIKYSLYSPTNTKSQDSMPYNMVNIDFLNEKTSGKGNSIDLIVLRDGYPQQSNGVINYEKVFEYIHSNLNTNGFLLILMRNDYTLPEKHLFDRFGIKYNDKMKDNQILTSMANKSGLSLISNRTDPKTCSSVLLMRNVEKNRQTNDIVLRMTESVYDPWFQTLKTELSKDSKTDSESIVWLICDHKKPNGIVGFVNCLRKELNGHRIRCISDENIYNSSAPFEAIRDNNLVMNIRKDSDFGSYRFIDLNEVRLTTGAIKHAMALRPKSKDISIDKWIECKHNSLPKQTQNIIVNVFCAGLTPYDIKRFKTETIKSVQMPPELGLCSQFSGCDEFGNRFMGIKSGECLSTSLAFNNLNEIISIPNHWSLESACTVPLAYGSAYLALIINARLDRTDSVLIHCADGAVGRAALAISLSIGCEIYATVNNLNARHNLLNDFPELDDTKVINTSMDCFKQQVCERTGGKGVDIVFNYTQEYRTELSANCLKPNGKYLSIEYHSNNALNKAVTCDKNIAVFHINVKQVFSQTNDDLLKYKVLDLIREGIAKNVVKPFNGKPVNAVHNTTFPDDRTYVLTGGLGGFGLELAHWLVERGAKHIALTSRSGLKNKYQEFCVNQLKTLGANVMISTLNASDPKECEQLMAGCEKEAPVAGIFCLAMVLSDGLFTNQTEKSMQKVFEPKIDAIKNLDTISRKLCPHLQYFVAFSSVSGGRGNAGQTNYGLANVYMQEVCESRRRQGLHGLAIQWGAIADVGVVTEHFSPDVQSIGATVPQRIHSCLSLMNHFLRSDDTVVSSLLRFEMKKPMDSTAKRDGVSDVVWLIGNILGVRDPSKIRPMAKLPELGMDSLMVVNIKQALESEFEVELELQQLTTLTIGEINKLCDKSGK